MTSKLGITSLGASQLAYSGTPLSSEITFIVPVFYNGRGDLGRTDTYTQTDLLASHSFRVGGNKRMVLEAYVLNLFNQDAVTNNIVRYNRNGSLNDTEGLYNGTLGNLENYINPINGAAPAQSASYGMPNAYQTGRTMTLGARFQF